MAKTPEKKIERKRKLTKKEPFVLRMKNLYEDERYRQFAGVFLVLFSLLMFVSFISFLGTWREDQDILYMHWRDYLFDTSVDVANFAGKIGVLVSNVFVYSGFGIAAFLLVALFALVGLRMMNVRTVNLRRFTKRTLYIVVLTSITFAFLFNSDLVYLGGGFGFRISSFLVSLVGKFGTVIVILLMILGYLTMTVQGFWFRTSALVKKVSSQETRNAAFGAVKENIVSKVTDKFNFSTQNEGQPVIVKPVTTMTDEISKVSEKIIKAPDFDDEEVKITERRNYKLFDDGNEKDLDSELGFEVQHTASTESVSQEKITNVSENEDVVEDSEEPVSTEMRGIAPILPHQLYGKLALVVEENNDILYENIDRPSLTNYDPKLDLSHYRVPPLELLTEHQTGDPQVTKEELIENKNKIVETLKHYKIEIQKIKATIGPTITLYEIIPAPGVRISKIKNLEDDIALSLSALGIRIIAPMPGRGTIGIEVPNQNPEMVSMRSMIRSAKFQEAKMDLPIALGKTISNETYVFDLTKMPHLLVAGATGQGKSVGLNAMLASILYKKHPSEVKLVLVDPKKVELTLYERLEKHFLATLPDAKEPIITDNHEVMATVSSLNIEMDNRYQLLKAAQARNIKEYNAKFLKRLLNPNKGHKFLPYIVLVIDEFADLIMTAGKEIELPIARLAQLARAVGIHLIVATQRPSTNIITGVIKANFPARIAFKVASMIDSRTILDSPGANQLIGRGDMLISQGSELIRLQCAFIDTPELEEVTKYIENQQGYPIPYLLPEPESNESDDYGGADLSKRDEMFEDAARLIVMNQQGSTSLIQRKMAIGYNRAGRIMDQLESAGIVGPAKGSKPRDVYIMDEYSLDNMLNSLP